MTPALTLVPKARFEWGFQLYLYTRGNPSTLQTLLPTLGLRPRPPTPLNNIPLVLTLDPPQTLQ